MILRLISYDPIIAYDCHNRLVENMGQFPISLKTGAADRMRPMDKSQLNVFITFLNGVGNRVKVEWPLPGESPFNTISYSANSLNQYASIADNGAEIQRTYSPDLNLANSGDLCYYYDYKGQLAAIDEDNSFTTPIATFAYDCHNRRVRKTGSMLFYGYDDWVGCGHCGAGNQFPIIIKETMDNSQVNVCITFPGDYATSATGSTSAQNPLTAAYASAGGVGEDTPLIQIDYWNCGSGIMGFMGAMCESDPYLVKDGFSTTVAR